jgi:S1-C subfamily serine protease
MCLSAGNRRRDGTCSAAPGPALRRAQVSHRKSLVRIVIVSIAALIIFLGAVSGSPGFAVLSAVAKTGGTPPTHGRQPDRPYIGISYVPVTEQIAQAEHLPVSSGDWITDVDRDCPAQKAGLRLGDVVLTIDGRPVTDEESLTSALLGLSVGNSMSLGVRRGAQTLVVNMTLGGVQGAPRP